MQEQWKFVSDISGFEDFKDYAVSNKGNVRSYKRSNVRELKTSVNSDGYKKVKLYVDSGESKVFSVHRLVMSLFGSENPDPDVYTQVNHIDENTLNNCIDNLEWCTPKQNSNHGTRNNRISVAHINREDCSKKVMCVETGCIYPSTMEVERQLGFTAKCIQAACKGISKSSYGYHWIYLEEGDPCG